MRLLTGLLLAVLLAALPLSVSAAEGDKTDLVIMLMWQAADGTVTDKRYIRHTETSEADCMAARGSARLVWSARKNSDMLGQTICIPAAAPVPTLRIGTFTIITDGN